MIVIFMMLLTLSAVTIATISIASSVSICVPTGRMQAVMFDVNLNDTEPNGDPVDGPGRGPG